MLVYVPNAPFKIVCTNIQNNIRCHFICRVSKFIDNVMSERVYWGSRENIYIPRNIRVYIFQKGSWITVNWVTKYRHTNAGCLTRRRGRSEKKERQGSKTIILLCFAFGLIGVWWNVGFFRQVNIKRPFPSFQTWGHSFLVN